MYGQGDPEASLQQRHNSTVSCASEGDLVQKLISKEEKWWN